jgi:hypothetical protein
MSPRLPNAVQPSIIIFIVVRAARDLGLAEEGVADVMENYDVLAGREA